MSTDINEKLRNSERPSSVRLQYPLDLGSNGENHVVQFNTIKYDKTGLYRFEVGVALETIRLPMPRVISNGDSLEYEEFSATLLTNLVEGAGAATSIIDVAKTLGVATGTLITPKIKEEASLASATFGVAINPRTMNVFKTPKARQYQFEYSMIAKNKRESDEIDKIVRLFRFRAYPDAATKDESMFISPELFTIRYMSLTDGTYDVNKYLPRPLPCALVGVNVDYNTYGEASFFKGSFAPVETKLTLSFLEMEIDTKQTLAQRYDYTDILGGA